MGKFPNQTATDRWDEEFPPNRPQKPSRTTTPEKTTLSGKTATTLEKTGWGARRKKTVTMATDSSVVYRVDKAYRLIRITVTWLSTTVICTTEHRGHQTPRPLEPPSISPTITWARSSFLPVPTVWQDIVALFVLKFFCLLLCGICFYFSSFANKFIFWNSVFTVHLVIWN